MKYTKENINGVQFLYKDRDTVYTIKYDGYDYWANVEYDTKYGIQNSRHALSDVLMYLNQRKWKSINSNHTINSYEIY